MLQGTVRRVADDRVYSREGEVLEVHTLDLDRWVSRLYFAQHLRELFVELHGDHTGTLARQRHRYGSQSRAWVDDKGNLAEIGKLGEQVENFFVYE